MAYVHTSQFVRQGTGGRSLLGLGRRSLKEAVSGSSYPGGN